MAKAASTTRQRPKRASVSGRQDILAVEGRDDNKEYRIVNDVPGRVDKLQAMGWEVDENAVLTSSMDNSKSDKSKHVGDGTKAVVMSMPKDWYNDYQKEKQAYVDRLEKKTKNQASEIEGGYGKVDIS